jgi:hypothetical protein
MSDIDVGLHAADVLDDLDRDLDEGDDFDEGSDEPDAEVGVDFDVIEGADFSVGFESELALDADRSRPRPSVRSAASGSRR